MYCHWNRLLIYSMSSYGYVGILLVQLFRCRIQAVQQVAGGRLKRCESQLTLEMSLISPISADVLY